MLNDALSVPVALLPKKTGRLGVNEYPLETFEVAPSITLNFRSSSILYSALRFPSTLNADDLSIFSFARATGL